MKLSLWFFLRETEYIELERSSAELQGAHEIGGAPRGRGRTPLSRGQGVAPLTWILLPVFLIFPKIRSVEFQVVLRTFVSAHK